MSSLRSHEGEFIIDHRNSPGVPEQLTLGRGLAKEAGKANTLFESACFTCSHCETVVVMNPDRSRSRGYCPKCDHYVCDECEAKRFLSGGVCLPFKVMVEQVLNQAAKKPLSSERFGIITQTTPPSPLLLP